MSYHLKGCDRDQLFLLPLSLKEWFEPGDLAWFLIDAVAQMNLRSFYERYLPTARVRRRSSCR